MRVECDKCQEINELHKMVNFKDKGILDIERDDLVLCEKCLERLGEWLMVK